MSKIDLSKAKIGDKFRTRKGYAVELKDIIQYMGDNIYRLTSSKVIVYVFQNGKMYKDNKASEFDLVEQIFDDEKDTIDREVVEAMNQAIKEIPEKAAEREQELQRRQEVVKLAEKLVTNELFAVTNHIHDMRELGAAINLESPAEYAFLIAEEFVSTREKYLKEGKL